MARGESAHIGLRWLDRLVLLGVIAVAVALMLGELGRLHWAFELASHFVVQYAIALAIACAYFLLRGRGLWFFVTIILVLVPAWRLAPYAPFWDQATTAATGTRQLRVMTINVQASNDRYDLVRAEIERLEPDVVFLPESTDRWVAGLAGLRERYPYTIDARSASVFSLLLISRVPLAESAIINLPEPNGFPAVLARICLEGADNETGCVRLIGIHPPPPLDGALATARDAALRAVPALVVAKDQERTILLGDFNCTPWSPVFRDLLTATGLRDTSRDFGLGSTWLSRWLPFGLTIDHVLAGKAIRATEHDVGRDVGSDHFPVVTTLRF